ncbi:MAG: hypothetical protein R3281_16985 [Balneolaceae bacterium]|nr:hypothetical protein [Balneolaceae bacterium]
MKLILLMCIEEYARDLRKILVKHGVPTFSETNIDGYRLEEGDIASNWFSTGGRRGIYSHLFFSFLETTKAEELMEAIKAYNEEKDDNHPLRAFLMNVEGQV